MLGSGGTREGVLEEVEAWRWYQLYTRKGRCMWGVEGGVHILSREGACGEWRGVSTYSQGEVRVGWGVEGGVHILTRGGACGGGGSGGGVSTYSQGDEGRCAWGVAVANNMLMNSSLVQQRMKGASTTPSTNMLGVLVFYRPHTLN